MGAIGLALIGVSLATYLLAAANDTGAWVALGVAAVITVAMPAIPVFYLRQLRGSPGRGSGARLARFGASCVACRRPAAPKSRSADSTKQAPGRGPGLSSYRDC